jgi:hypothetical protein
MEQAGESIQNKGVTIEGCEIIFWQTRFPVMLSKAKHLGRE